MVVMAGLTEERCEKTDLPAYSCPCSEHLGLEKASGPKRTETEHPPPSYDGDLPSKDAIFVSSTGLAHWYGACSGLPRYEYLVPPRWGWISDRTLWPRIGPNHPVPADGGNTRLVAERRCGDCET
jgi:hypothetical protein